MEAKQKRLRTTSKSRRPNKRDSSGLPDTVVVIPVKSLATPAQASEPIYAGLRLRQPASSSPRRFCTAGFTVRNISSGVRGISTAGHCENNLTYLDKPLAFQTEISLQGSVDLQWHLASGFDIKNWAFDGLFDSTTPNYRPITATKSRSSIRINEYVCKFGQTTLYGCGYVISTTSKISSVTNSNETFLRISNNQGSNNALTQVGDSGGPWYSGNSALATTVAFDSGTGDGLAMSVDYFSNLGLSVLTQ